MRRPGRVTATDCRSPRPSPPRRVLGCDWPRPGPIPYSKCSCAPTRLQRLRFGERGGAADDFVERLRPASLLAGNFRAGIAGVARSLLDVVGVGLAGIRLARIRLAGIRLGCAGGAGRVAAPAFLLA